jgi:PKD repeat protein
MLVVTSQVFGLSIFYVDATNGNDLNNGLSEVTAWQTIAKVNSSSFSPGDKILLKRGDVWREQLIVPSSGNAGNPIAFGAYGTGADPIINGSDLVTDWALYITNVWVSYLAVDTSQVFFDGKKGNKQLSLANVDSEYDWYCDSNFLYVYSTSDPDTHTIEVGQRPYCIYSSGKDYIVVDGLQLQYSNFNNRGIITISEAAEATSTGWTIQNCTIKEGAGSGIFFYAGIGYLHDTIIYNNVIHDNGVSGIRAEWIDGNAGNENIISNNTIYNNPSLGIQCIANYWIIENNEVYSNGTNSGGGIGIANFDYDGGYGENCIVRYNIVRDNNGSGNNGSGIFADYLSDNNQIYYNLIYGNWGSGIDVYSANNVDVFNNVCYGNVQGSPRGQRAEIRVIEDGSHECSNVVLNNNIAQATETNEYAIYVGKGAHDSSGLDITNNCWYRASGDWWYYNSGGGSSLDTWNEKIGVGTDLNSVPLMTNPGSDDFKLQEGSPCINAGTDVGLTQDYAGNTVPYGCCVDIGAFEFIGTPNILNAEINASPTSGTTPLTVSYTGNATGGSSPYFYSWDFGDGESSSEQNPSHTYNGEGSYTANLTVADSNDSQASDSVIITAIAPADPLSVSASASPTSGAVPLTVSFSASANGGTSPYSYSWDFGDDASSSEQNPSHTYNQAGTFNVNLTVTDSESSQAWNSLTIEVSSNPTFTLNISSVTGSPAPANGGTTDPDPGSHSYSQGTSVQVKAVPNSDYRFSKWSGDVSSSNAYDEEISVTMDNDKSISGYFFTKCGDVNGDLSITAADAQSAFDIYLGRIADPTESEKENADVNCDGTATSPNVTPADAHAIFEKFIGRNELPCDCSCSSRAGTGSTQMRQAPAVNLIINDIQVNQGEEILVTVIVDNFFNIKAFGFDLLFPSEILEYKGVEKAELKKNFLQLDANKIAEGLLRVGGYRSAPIMHHSPRVLITLIFRVTGEAKELISFIIINTVDDIRNASCKNRKLTKKIKNKK